MEDFNVDYVLSMLEEVKPMKEQLLVNPNTLIEGNVIPQRIVAERDKLKKQSNQVIGKLQSYFHEHSYVSHTAKQLSSMYASENLGSEYVKRLLKKEEDKMGNIPKRYQKLLKKPNPEEKYVNKFKQLKQLKHTIIEKEQSKDKEFNSYSKEIQDIYHTIESEVMGASDMYNVMKALQYQVRKSREVEKNTSLASMKKEFERLGGMKEYVAIKNYLTDKGVNVNELN